ncbi:MAG: hypothetical protein OXH96_08825 [Spirochaetaceae bacterium]|nr:hypothetical protein [Spirochaetaceae bacterium]
MKLYIFHYHLLPGGVTTVIRDGARAMLAHRGLFPGLTRLVVVAGGENDGGLGAHGGCDQPLGRRRLDAVAYDDAPATIGGRRQLADLLLRRFGDGVWWIHNHHLAKNTRFTGAVLMAAAAGHPMILQIHDFPENARPANLARLHDEVPASPYPSGDNVRYAVLNRRDHDALAGAGCPGERVALLANPVRPAAPVPAPAAATARAARARLAESGAAGRSAGTGTLDRGRPLWLYPVRVRRRKNVLEAGLLARLAGANLVVTLPASSAAETAYSREVERLYGDGAIPGLYGVGDRLDALGLAFDDLLAAAHLIVSPSVEEGFGFQFVNALQWRRPLLARRLPVLDDLQGLLDGYPAALYDAVRCPLTSSERNGLRAAYEPAAQRATRLLPGAAGEHLRAELDTILSGDTVDFSYLGTAQQAALLRRCGDRGVARELRHANAALLDTVRSLPQRPLPDRDQPIEAAFGEAAFARRAAALLAPLLARGGASRTPPADGATRAVIDPAAVQRTFAKPAALRLLMER